LQKVREEYKEIISLKALIYKKSDFEVIGDGDVTLSAIETKDEVLAEIVHSPRSQKGKFAQQKFISTKNASQ